MKSVVKVSWSRDTPELKLATENGYEAITLSRGRKLNLEVVEDRRCVGFHDSQGSMTPCPEFRKIDSGDQCGECRGKDIYTDFRRGNSGKGLESDYSVYMVQIGDQLKVGVTRTDRIQRRWKEQGAVLAAEIKNGLSADEALELESEISRKGVSERIRKNLKTGFEEDILSNKIQDLGFNAEVHEILQPLECREIVRRGRIPSPIRQVNGQIISNGKVGLALSSGKCIVRARQKELQDFQTE